MPLCVHNFSFVFDQWDLIFLSVTGDIFGRVGLEVALGARLTDADEGDYYSAPDTRKRRALQILRSPFKGRLIAFCHPAPLLRSRPFVLAVCRVNVPGFFL